MQPPAKSFTSSYDRMSRVLQNEVHITDAFKPSSITGTISPQTLNAKKYSAIWDTGATGTVITQKVVNDLGLKQVGVTQLTTASGKKDDAPLYLVAIFLPNLVYRSELMVVEASVTGNAEVLIGMDIIGSGDFAVTNKDGKTVFTFRMPSIERIDFAKQQPRISSPPGKIGRNDPCPCGSGKKFKKCHGK
ncbi:unnamed protein product [marine sediment metagenome]|uniref:Peptidase A2 domain-containing protein n=1 Tax=marine sediment metagenome TaxID=412755 RepID=X1TET3_9ZZZZ